MANDVVKGAKGKKGTTKVKAGKVVTNVIVNIYASYNNTIVGVTDMKGNLLAQASAGMDFSGARQRTPHAAQQATAKACLKTVQKHSSKVAEIRVRGIGAGRDAAIREAGKRIDDGGYFEQITMIVDRTGIPHNGCRASKERRV